MKFFIQWWDIYYYIFFSFIAYVLLWPKPLFAAAFSPRNACIRNKISHIKLACLRCIGGCWLMEFLWHFSHTQRETSRLNYCDEKCSGFSSINIVEWLVSHFEIYSRDFAIMNILKMSVFYCFLLFSFCTAEHFEKGFSSAEHTWIFIPEGDCSFEKCVRFKNCFSDNAEKSEFLIFLGLIHVREILLL